MPKVETPLTPLETKLLAKCEDGLKMVNTVDKGRGVETTRPFAAGDFVVEYDGEVISAEDAADIDDHTYIYHFTWDGETKCIDARKDTGRLGRLITSTLNQSESMLNQCYGNFTGSQLLLELTIRSVS